MREFPRPDEYEAFSTAVAILKLDWRVFLFSGPDRKQFLQGLVSNDILGLEFGHGVEACVLTPKGKIRAYAQFYDGKDCILAICPAACGEAFKAAFEKVIMLSQTRMEEITGRCDLFFAAGPRAGAILAEAVSILPPQQAWGFNWTRLSPDGYWTVFPKSERAFLEDTAKKHRVPTASNEAFEALRLEAGFPFFNVDYNEEYFPQEAGLEHCVSYSKGCYLGQETMSRLYHMGHVNKRLVSIKIAGAKVPESGALVLWGDAEAGRLTSAAFSPRYGAVLGLGILSLKALESGESFRIKSVSGWFEAESKK